MAAPLLTCALELPRSLVMLSEMVYCPESTFLERHALQARGVWFTVLCSASSISFSCRRVVNMATTYPDALMGLVITSS
jgi:hypothetical protein